MLGQKLGKNRSFFGGIEGKKISWSKIVASVDQDISGQIKLPTYTSLLKYSDSLYSMSVKKLVIFRENYDKPKKIGHNFSSLMHEKL